MTGTEKTRLPWFGGLTCDHLYADCPSRTRVLNGPSRLDREWCEVEGDGLDPYGADVCGLCLHRYQRRNRQALPLKYVERRVEHARAAR